MAGIYIHIPFCKQACYYCDFHFSTNQQLTDEVVNAISKELLLQKDYLGKETIQTIYFGGGTPSLLTEKQLSLILNSIHKYYAVAEDAEITLEANPDDLTFDKLKDLKNASINRLSIGVQSFNDEVLSFLNRAHGSKDAIKCLELANDTGFENISLDLIYGIPNRNDRQWENDLKQAISYHPTHISSYCLTIEPQTVFGRWKDKGKLEPVSDEVAATQFEILLETLRVADYEQYEVSNFCLQGFESKHNSSYWKQKSYLGVGPSAHSYNKTSRQFNVNHNKKYIDALKEDAVPFTVDKLSREDHINDYLLTTLRTKWGSSLIKLMDEYNYDLILENKHYIDILLKENKAVIENNYLKLSKQGLLFADEISSNLFLI